MGRGDSVFCVIGGPEYRRTRRTSTDNEWDAGKEDDNLRSVYLEEHPRIGSFRRGPAGEPSGAFQSESPATDPDTVPATRAQSLSARVGRQNDGWMIESGSGNEGIGAASAVWMLPVVNSRDDTVRSRQAGGSQQRH